MDIRGITNGTSASGSQPPGATQLPGTDSLANEQTFLKLFVAQLKNQDPTNPMDGSQFVAQLAQFSQLEQSLQMRQDLDAMLKIINTPPATGGTTPSQPATTVSQ